MANKTNSIDVDKLDYMTRDSYYFGLKDTYFDYRAIIKESRVIDNEVCFPSKVFFTLLFKMKFLDGIQNIRTVLSTLQITQRRILE